MGTKYPLLGQGPLTRKYSDSEEESEAEMAARLAPGNIHGATSVARSLWKKQSTRGRKVKRQIEAINKSLETREQDSSLLHSPPGRVAILPARGPPSPSPRGRLGSGRDSGAEDSPVSPLSPGVGPLSPDKLGISETTVFLKKNDVSERRIVLHCSPSGGEGGSVGGSGVGSGEGVPASPRVQARRISSGSASPSPLATTRGKPQQQQRMQPQHQQQQQPVQKRNSNPQTNQQQQQRYHSPAQQYQRQPSLQNSPSPQLQQQQQRSQQQRYQNAASPLGRYTEQQEILKTDAGSAEVGQQPQKSPKPKRIAITTRSRSQSPSNPPTAAAATVSGSPVAKAIQKTQQNLPQNKQPASPNHNPQATQHQQQYQLHLQHQQQLHHQMKSLEVPGRSQQRLGCTESSGQSPGHGFTPRSSRDTSPYTTLVQDMQMLGGGAHGRSSSTSSNPYLGVPRQRDAVSPQPGHKSHSGASPRPSTTKSAPPQSFSRKPEKSVIDDDLMSDVYNELAILEETISAIEAEPIARSRTTSLSSLRSPNMSDSCNFPCCSPDATEVNLQSFKDYLDSEKSEVTQRLQREFRCDDERRMAQRVAMTRGKKQRQLSGNSDGEGVLDDYDVAFPPPPPLNPTAFEMDAGESSLSPPPPPPERTRGRGRSDSISDSVGSYDHQEVTIQLNGRNAEVSPLPYLDEESEKSVSPSYYYRWNAEEAHPITGASMKPGLRLLADVLKKPKPKASLLQASVDAEVDTKGGYLESPHEYFDRSYKAPLYSTGDRE